MDTENKKSRRLLNQLPLTLQYSIDAEQEAAASDYEQDSGDHMAAASHNPAQARGMGGRVRQAPRGNAPESF